MIHDPGIEGVEEDGLTDLDRETCLGLLAGLDVGRVAWIEGERVMVFPLNCAVDGDAIVVRTFSSTILAAAARLPELTFQGDEFEPAVHAGWTVLVSGPAAEVVEPAEVERAQKLVEPWRDDGPFRVLRIHAERVIGRRLELRPGAIDSVYIE